MGSEARSNRHLATGSTKNGVVCRESNDRVSFSLTDIALVFVC